MITQSQVIYISGVSIAGLAALAYLNRQPPPPVPDQLKFTNENITQRFTAALPEICPVLNLELAMCKQVETFTQTEECRVLWGLVDLGTNVVQVSVPVSYRFHIRVRDAWKLETAGNRVIVKAPGLHSALPPAIHTDG